MHPNQKDDSDTIQTQIVVVGGGGAGLAAAVAAVERGAKVTILEKMSKCGGNALKSYGIFAADSSVQRSMNINANRDLLFETIVDYSHWRITADIVNAYIDKSSDSIEWLKKQGIAFNLSPVNRKVFQMELPPLCHCPEGYGAELVKIMVKRFTELGGQIVYNVRATQLLADEKNKIIGVLAARDKKNLKILSGKVIIATGGFAGNKDLLKKYCPYYKDSMNLTGAPNTGDGISMATSAGASTDGLGIFLAEAKGLSSSNQDLLNVVVQPQTIWLNNIGKRYVDEASGPLTETSNAIFRFKNLTNYTLFDESIKQIFIDEGFRTGISVGLPPSADKTDDLNTSINKAVANDEIKVSNNLPEIAEWMAVMPDTLNETVTEYNASCQEGRDPLFLKNPDYLKPLNKPPYYAIKCTPFIFQTMGGIKINHNMQVLNNENNPIDGLYAAGAEVGGWEPDTFSLWLMAPLSGFLPGYSMGFSINSGRIAGENAAK